MKTITHSTSAYLVYELKGFNFLILECYGDTNTGRENTSYNNLKPNSTHTDSWKGIKILSINGGIYGTEQLNVLCVSCRMK
jgi:hypothetical protein